VLAVTSVIRVWKERPAVLEPEEQTEGRPRRNVRLAPGAAKAQTVAEVIAELPKSRWRRLSIAVGTKGPVLPLNMVDNSTSPFQAHFSMFMVMKRSRQAFFSRSQAPSNFF